MSGFTVCTLIEALSRSIGVFKINLDAPEASSKLSNAI